MTMLDMDDLAERLAAMGEMLVFDDPDPTAGAIARVTGASPARPSRHRMLLVAAAIVAVTVAAVLFDPDTRTAIARWFGIGGVEVQVDPNLEVDPDAPSTFDLPGPGDSVEMTVGGHRILVSAIPARANEALVEKTVAAANQVQPVEVGGHAGLWIGGAPHEVLYETLDGDVEVRRVAANTLLWFDGRVLYRVEGFDELADALEFAQQGT
jgi:hypothetical protein